MAEDSAQKNFHMASVQKSLAKKHL